MSRTRYEVPVADASSALKAMENILFQKKFEKKLINSESVYVKGDGIISPMQCVGVSLGDKVIILEGWIKDPIMGESELKGFVSMVPKKSLKGTLDTVITAMKYAGNGQI